ncbi:MAG: DUF2680 domain-containing protein [Clostridium sp.]
MINLKKTMILSAMVLTIGGASVTTFAASNYKTPAEAVAALTSRTVESVTSQKTETGKSYGSIAKEAGVLPEFKAENLEIKKDKINAKVASGKITQEEADALIAKITEKQANCDGTGTEKIGKSNGLGLGSGSGAKNGHGQKNGTGKNGLGQKQGNGTCTVAETSTAAN